MLMVKSYFLSEQERMNLEEFIEEKLEEVTLEEIQNLDDKELLTMYRNSIY